MAGWIGRLLTPDGAGRLVMGGAYLFVSVLLIGLMTRLVPVAITYLTSVPGVAQQAVEIIRGLALSGVGQAGGAGTAGGEGTAGGAPRAGGAPAAAPGGGLVSPLSLDMLVALEYESMMLRVQGMQVALGMVAGLAFIPGGLVLFAVGATGGFRFGGRAGGAELDAVGAAPGLALVLIGGLLIGLAITKDVRRTFDLERQTGTPGESGVFGVGPPRHPEGAEFPSGSLRDRDGGQVGRPGSE